MAYGRVFETLGIECLRFCKWFCCFSLSSSPKNSITNYTDSSKPAAAARTETETTKTKPEAASSSKAKSLSEYTDEDGVRYEFLVARVHLFEYASRAISSAREGVFKTTVGGTPAFFNLPPGNDLDLVIKKTGSGGRKSRGISGSAVRSSFRCWERRLIVIVAVDAAQTFGVKVLRVFSASWETMPLLRIEKSKSKSYVRFHFRVSVRGYPPDPTQGKLAATAARSVHRRRCSKMSFNFCFSENLHWLFAGTSPCVRGPRSVCWTAIAPVLSPTTSRTIPTSKWKVRWWDSRASRRKR